MALRWFDGFDTYPTADIALRYNIPGGGSFQTVPGAGRFGSGALRNAISGGGEVLAKFFDDQPTWVVGVAYKFTPAGKATTVIALQDSGNGQVELFMDSSNILTLRRNGTVVATGTTTLLANTFYFLEFKATISGSGSMEARIGGVSEVTFSGNTDAQSSGHANRVCLYYDQFQTQASYDDYYVCDGTGARNNTFLGDMRVEDLVPSAQGSHADFSHTGAASSLLAVNEAGEDGDTSYVWSNTVGDKETFTYPNLSSVPSLIAGVQVVAVARKDDAGTRALTPLFRIGGVDYPASQLALPDSYTYLGLLTELNPATGAPWTGADVNAVEAGFSTTQ